MQPPIKVRRTIDYVTDLCQLQSGPKAGEMLALTLILNTVSPFTSLQVLVVMALSCLTRALRSLTLSQPALVSSQVKTPPALVLSAIFRQ